MIRTYHGNILFDYHNPTKEMIDIKDILLSLSRINRFLGHSREAHSVLVHSYICAKYANLRGFSERIQLLCLMHDFTEAYVGDCPAPLKELLPEYKKIEKRVENVIYEAFDVPPPTKDEEKIIKEIDVMTLALEMNFFTKHNYKLFLAENNYTDVPFEDDLLDMIHYYDGLNVNNFSKFEFIHIFTELLPFAKG